MKTYLLFAATVVLFTSCSTTSYFESPNNLQSLSGTLYLNNGQTVEGKLTVRKNFGGEVKVLVPGERKAQRYSFAEVDGYMIRDQYYELKEMRDSRALIRAYRFHFMKRLTPASSKIHLYEFLDKETSRTGDNTFTTLEKNYYMQLPSETGDGVWDIGLSKFVPNFDEKMSKLVEDCPALSQKIAAKEKGYFYSQLGGSEEKRVDMLWNIISEYNKCR